MFSRFKKKNIKHRLAARTPENTRIYAIGDIHGCSELLQKLHDLIIEDAATCDLGRRKVIVYIGDYIDRGAESRQVIDSFVSGKIDGFERVFIKGNHEQAMIKFIENPECGEIWIAWGGYATLQSYDVNMDDANGKRLNAEQLCDGLKKNMPESHLQFLQELETSHIEGDYIFVHAGIRPEVLLEKQTDNDMMMI